MREWVKMGGRGKGWGFSRQKWIKGGDLGAIYTPFMQKGRKYTGLIQRITNKYVYLMYKIFLREQKGELVGLVGLVGIVIMFCWWGRFGLCVMIGWFVVDEIVLMRLP